VRQDHQAVQAKQVEDVPRPAPDDHIELPSLVLLSGLLLPSVLVCSNSFNLLNHETRNVVIKKH
jgi:hypothetical protein